MELYLTFLEPHRVRYMTADGVVHDEYIEVKYEFTTIESSIQLQSDLRSRDLIDWFDVDVVWSDTHRRTDSYGNVRGLGTIQRMKLWRDRYSTFHYLTFYANQRRRWKEYLLDDFDRELRNRDDRHRRLQLGARGARRGSASEGSQSQGGRRFSAAAIFRSRHSTPLLNGGGSSSSSSSSPSLTDIRYLGIQFSRNSNVQPGTDGESFPPATARDPEARERLTKCPKDYRRFISQWDAAHRADGEFDATFPTNHVELPSSYINGVPERRVNGVAELESPALAGRGQGRLPPVAEPGDGLDSDETQ